MEKLEIEKESLKARLEIDERSDGVISSQSASGAPTVAAWGCSIPFCSLHNLKKMLNLRGKMLLGMAEEKFVTIGLPIIAKLLSKGSINAMLMHI
jgi:predicted aconitase